MNKKPATKNAWTTRLMLTNLMNMLIFLLMGEIKTNKNASLLDIIMDFHRIAMFCKDSMDKYSLHTTIGF